jgi:hypothetical protein
MRRSRFLILHPDTNQSKIDHLERLHTEYVAYVQLCVIKMIESHRFNLKLSEKRTFFPTSNILTSHILKCAQDHAITFVFSWIKSIYSTKIKDAISLEKRLHLISDEEAKILYSIGKYVVDAPTKTIGQVYIDRYWLFIDKYGGSKPTITKSIPMIMSEGTATLTKSQSVSKYKLWMKISTLERRKRVYLPLMENPYISNLDDFYHGILVHKTKDGRWIFDLYERRDYQIPPLEESPKEIGIDTGLNVIASLSDGTLYGTNFKPKFDRLNSKIKKIRANRQRQGLKNNSPKLDVLETKLSRQIKSEVGKITNKIINQYGQQIFIVEDLTTLCRTKGSKRFSYLALQKALSDKAHIKKINPAYTSQECDSCGYISRYNRYGVNFQCKGCGRKCHADVMGAKNILRRSGDKYISCKDHYTCVRQILRKRYLHRRSSNSKPDFESSLRDQRLTIRVDHIEDHLV